MLYEVITRKSNRFNDCTGHRQPADNSGSPDIVPSPVFFFHRESNGDIFLAVFSFSDFYDRHFFFPSGGYRSGKLYSKTHSYNFV